jgi:hypothetical protein
LLSGLNAAVQVKVAFPVHFPERTRRASQKIPVFPPATAIFPKLQRLALQLLLKQLYPPSRELGGNQR